ncbi:efflux RND transporter periplasmic adaptor subunit [Sulfurimonas marina]|uniref:Efflux RND transporter periplasmic adaptor subunit n=1 Tax=Sulfurimonas marina TaxID=2590551 RepID=A0A7M1B0B7_9BACT|nr:efflux RND transporter periplasmic adaptor subunit [Sulfurimonas marina]QOP42168.1 efflux RND transporter periplasmic adaptor subunit [Sulfurimonas marina]
MKEQSLEETIGVHKTKKSQWKRWLIWLGLIVVIGAVAGMKFMPEQKRIEYKTEAAKSRDIVITVSATGNLEPTNTVDVGIEVSGTITEVYVDFNDHVKKGEVLAKIDTTKLESKVRNSKAALAVAKADLENTKVSLHNAKVEYERAQSLFKSTGGNYPSSKEMDATKTTYDLASASYTGKKALVLQAEANLQSNEDDLRKAVVHSPLEGIILDRSIDVGQSVVASMQVPVLFTIAENLAKMELSVSVDEADIGQVQKGQSVTFSVDAYPKKTFSGTITKVQFNSEIVDGVVTYNAIVAVNNDNLLLRPGMTATAQIKTQELKQVLTIPNAALRYAPKSETMENTKGERVWSLENGKPKAQDVVLGESDGVYTIVKSGLAKDTQVIIGSK